MCKNCNKQLPFSGIRNFEQNIGQEHSASDDMRLFFRSLNDFNHQHSTSKKDTHESDPVVDCKYIDTENFNSVKFDDKSFNILHLNIASLAAHKEELETVLENFHQKFDVIGISETKIKKDVIPNFDIDLKGYKTYSTPTLANKGGVILYISEKHKSKPRNDLNKIISKPHVLESVFTEIVVPNKKNIVLGCIYRHPSMELQDFNVNYLEPLMDKLNQDKHIFLHGDFNVDLIKTESDKETAVFFDNLSSNLFVPHITLPTRITPHSKTLINNIFSNVTNFLQGKSGNITLSISDHLAQFLSIPLDANFKAPQSTKYKRNMKDFDRENFFLDLLSVDWDEILQTGKNDPNHSFQRYYHIINTLIDKYMPLQKMTKKEIKQQSKPWITQEILKDIEKRDKLQKMYIETNDENSKAQLNHHFKELRCKIQTDIKNSKKNISRNSLPKMQKTSKKPGKESNPL